MDELAERVFDLAREQYEAMDTTLGEGELPRTFQGDSLLVSTSAWWGSGFYPGSLWYIYYYTGDSEVKALAEKYTERLYKESLKARSHDIGFMINCSYGNALRITGDSKYSAPMQTAAIELAKRFNNKVGCTRSWNFSPKGKNVTWEFPVIIDNMMNLELLEEAYKLTGTDSLDVIARTHANTTILNHFREDYSSFHVVDYDPLDGHVRMKMTHQGYSDDSAWARGQAWGLYGFTMMYRETDDSTYLAQAEKIAAMLLQRLPEDGIPYWDMKLPQYTAQTERDASASAICAYVDETAPMIDNGVEVSGFKQVAGGGLTARVAGDEVLVGNARLMQQHGINIAALQSRSDALAAEAKTALYVASDGKALGLIAVADPIKPTSAEAIARLRGLGVRTIMLTGDQATTAEAVARQVGLDEVVAGVLPSDKEQKVRTLQEEGALVAMVGDGINDAPALARADVGIAIGAGTDIAISSADVVLMRSDLRDVATAIELSRATMRNIRQNLFWALFYNAICIPVAVGVLTPLGITLNPMIGAAAMGFSSVFVVSNALRLRTWKPSETVAESTTTNNPVVGSAAREDEGSTEMKAKTLKVEGMMCEHCVARVKDVLEKAGAKNVEVSLEEGTAKLEAGLLLSDAKLVKAVEDAGYKATMA